MQLPDSPFIGPRESDGEDAVGVLARRREALLPHGFEVDRNVEVAAPFRAREPVLAIRALERPPELRQVRELDCKPRET